MRDAWADADERDAMIAEGDRLRAVLTAVERERDDARLREDSAHAYAKRLLGDGPNLMEMIRRGAEHIERLKAENASLMESLREDHRVADQALAFAHHERDALRSENAKMREAAGNGCGVCHCRALAAAEQRAEAAEKELEAAVHDAGCDREILEDTRKRARAAAKRATDLMTLLRDARHYADLAPTRPIELLARIDAALHDEERRPVNTPGHPPVGATSTVVPDAPLPHDEERSAPQESEDGQ